MENAYFIGRWGEIITAEGDGGGAFSFPAALDKYERALGLKPDEAWLMKRLLVRAWTDRQVVWLSFREISRQADISKNTLFRLRDSLLEKGYIAEVMREHELTRRRIHYALGGVLKALEYAIMCNPDSDWAKVNGAYTMADIFHYEPFACFTTPKQVNEYRKKNGIPGIYWGDDASLSQEEQEKRNRYSRLSICENCGGHFVTYAVNAKRCKNCSSKGGVLMDKIMTDVLNQYDNDGLNG